MEATFKILETSRNIYLKFLEGYTLEQLNKIPEGFSNNLIWNIGHIVVSQQGLIYRLSGLPVNVSDEMTEKYKNEDITTIDGVKIDFAENWVHLRKSNTEPIIRIYTEAPSQDAADKLALRIIDEIKVIAGI